MAKTRSHRPESAKAMAFPPAPQNRSISVVLVGGAAAAMCSAILLDATLDFVGDCRACSLHCYCFWCDAEPGVVREVDALVVF